MTRNKWTMAEVEALIKQFDRPVQELLKMFPRHNQASLDRKINRLRKEGKIGYKSQSTVDEAYALRHK